MFVSSFICSSLIICAVFVCISALMPGGSFYPFPPYHVIGEVSLDDIMTDKLYDLISLYQDTEDVITTNDSPFQYSPQTCNYYDPNEFK